jgi:hypothetical protein
MEMPAPGPKELFVIVDQGTLPVQPGGAQLRCHLSITGWAKLRASSGLLSAPRAGKNAGNTSDVGRPGFEGEMTKSPLFVRKR